MVSLNSTVQRYHSRYYARTLHTFSKGVLEIVLFLHQVKIYGILVFFVLGGNWRFRFGLISLFGFFGVFCLFVFYCPRTIRSSIKSCAGLILGFRPANERRRYKVRPCLIGWGANLDWRRFKNAQELLNMRALKISILYKNHIFRRMGKIFCVEFQRFPLKFHTKYITHTLKNVDFIHRWKLKSS